MQDKGRTNGNTMKQLVQLLVAASTIFLLATLVSAQKQNEPSNSKKPPLQLEFERLDTNRDKKVDAEEYLDGSVGKAAGNKQQQFAESDVNKDGSLDLGEFQKTANQPADPAMIRKDFKQRDKDGNGSLTLKEHIGDRMGDQKTEARTWFFRFDTDENEQLTLQEFLNRNSKAKVSVHNQFRVHDINDDGQLTEQEFMRTRTGKSYEKLARDNFRKFDFDRDQRLKMSEFASLLSNASGATLRSTIEQNGSRRAWTSWFDRWGIRLLIGFDIFLVIFAAVWVYRRFGIARGLRTAQPRVGGT
jgi:Ca2+-binding EF-hand superfamily protein